MCWKVAVSFVAAVYMKKTGNLRDSSKLDPLIFSVFFSLLRKPGWLRHPDCRFVDLCVWRALSLRELSPHYKAAAKQQFHLPKANFTIVKR